MKVENLASAVKEEAVHMGETVADKANAAVASVGEKVSGLAGSIRAHTPAVVAPYTENATAKLDFAGEYLQTSSVGGIAEDVMDLINKHPVVTALAVGYLIGRRARK